MVVYPLSVSQLSRNLFIYTVGFFQISVFACPAPYAQMFFEFLNKNVLNVFQFFMIFFPFLLTWDPMGGKVFKRYSSLKSLLHFTKLLNFLLIGPHKSTILDFLNFEFTIFHDFFSFSLSWEQKLQNAAAPPSIHF